MGTLTDNFKVGAFRAEVSRNRLLLGDEAFALEPQVMNVLCVLAENPDQVMSREDLIDRVWQLDHGGDESLTRAISRLRKTFRGAGEKGLYIETIYTRGYRLAVPVTLTPNEGQHQSISSSQPPKVSLAVLAFADMSPDQNQEHFADGMSEEIINALVKLSFMRITGRTSSFAFKNTQKPIKDIAKDLNVDYILEGSVRKQENQVRITVQLIQAKEDKHLWSDSFDGTLTDVFGLQQSVARGVEQELNRIFNGVNGLEEKQPVTAPTSNAEAYDFFIRGRALTQQKDGQDTLPRAVEFFKKTVALDPEFAEAWAYLARANFYLIEHSKTPHWQDYVRDGKHAIDIAMKLDPDLAIGHSTLSYRALLEKKADERVKACQRALARDPKNPVFIYTLGSALASIGQSQRGLELMEEAMDLEPLCASWTNGLGHPKFALLDFEGAEESYRRSYELGFDSAMFMLTFLLTHLGRKDESIKIVKQQFERVGPLTQNPWAPKILRMIGLSAFYTKRVWARQLIRMITAAHVNNKKTQPYNGLAFRCFYLGYPGLFMKVIRLHPHPYMGAALAQLWTPAEEAKRIRTHPDFPQFAEDIGLVRAWQSYGWPEKIRPIEGTDGSNGQFICT